MTKNMNYRFVSIEQSKKKKITRLREIVEILRIFYF